MVPLPWGGRGREGRERREGRDGTGEESPSRVFAIFMMCCYPVLKIAREKFVGAARAKEKTPESPAAHKGPRARETHAGCTSGVPASGGKTSQGEDVHWDTAFVNHGASKLHGETNAWTHDPNLWNPHAGRDLSICALYLPNIAQGCLFSRPKTRRHGPRSVCLAAHPRGVVSLLLHQAVVALARRNFLELFFKKFVHLPQHAFCLSVQCEIQI